MDIQALLGDDAESLLTHTSKGITKELSRRYLENGKSADGAPKSAK